MAAVTINTRTVNVSGSRRQFLFNITGANAGTLVTGLNNVQQVNVQLVSSNPPSVVTSSGGTLTFTAGGTFTTNVEVIGN
jgi:hypothetical protein